MKPIFSSIFLTFFSGMILFGAGCANPNPENSSPVVSDSTVSVTPEITEISSCKPVYHDPKNDWESEKLFGKVSKMARSRKKTAKGENSEAVKNLEVHFDATGKIIFQANYLSDGELKIETEFEYDEKGNLVRWESQYFNPDKRSYLEYKCDEAGLLKRCEGMTVDAEPKTIEYKYDDFGNKIFEREEIAGKVKQTTYEFEYGADSTILSQKTNVDGKLVTTDIFTYNGNGFWIEAETQSSQIGKIVTTRECDAEGKIFSMTHSESDVKTRRYEYNDCFQVQRSFEYRKGDLYRERKMEYEYDKYGNWTKCKTFEKRKGEADFKLIFEETREFEYFD